MIMMPKKFNFYFGVVMLVLAGVAYYMNMTTWAIIDVMCAVMQFMMYEMKKDLEEKANERKRKKAITRDSE